MTRLACVSSVLLVALACFLHQLPTVTCQLASPEVKKISILDLFQEEPSLKAELEARLQEKKKVPAEGETVAAEPKPTPKAMESPKAVESPKAEESPKAVESPKIEESPKTEQVPEAEEPAAEEPASSPPETASQDRRRRPSRLAARGIPRTATADEPISDAAQTEAVEKSEEPGRRLRPHRLALRRNRPGLAGGSTTTTEGPEVPEPELEKELVDELNAAEVPQEAEGSTTTTASPGGRKLRARFSLPPRNGAAAKPSVPTERKEEAPATASATGPASGLNRLRNARFGGSKTRNAGSAGNNEESPADDTASAAPAKKTTRLSLAERRSRFSNARLPPFKAEAAEETAADTDATGVDAEDPEATDSQSPRRNARRFPTLARRNS